MMGFSTTRLSTQHVRQNILIRPADLATAWSWNEDGTGALTLPLRGAHGMTAPSLPIRGLHLGPA